MENIALAVVIRYGRVLIQERYRKNRGMVFEFPGGTIDPSETPEAAAFRELWEETSVKADAHIATYSDENEFGGKVFFVVMAIDDAALPQPTDPLRLQSFHWCKIPDIPLHTFHRADINFIVRHLPKYIRHARRC
ncbi:NUDIX hydrolase [Parasalinivibrio latis]|uniref:NUDIX hydrolase n=1 Tax=Parasalinivibrio latis TaxID=2952610 RepID=UPI0030E0FDDB